MQTIVSLGPKRGLGPSIVCYGRFRSIHSWAKLAVWPSGAAAPTRHVVRLQGQTGRLASPALDDDDIVAVVARHICGQSVVLAATFVVVVHQRAPACDTRWPKPCFGHGWAADPIGVSCRYQAKQGGWPFFSTTVRYDCQNSCGQSRLVATRRWPSDGPSLARRMGHWFDIFHKASSLGTLLSYQYSYSRLRLSKLGAIDTRRLPEAFPSVSLMCPPGNEKDRFPLF